MKPKVTLFGLEIPSYFLLISVSCILAILFALRRCKSRSLQSMILLDLSAIVLISGFVGARLLHIFFEAPSLYINAPLRVFEFWRGGFTYYGGFFAALVAGVFYLRRRKESVLSWGDAVCPAVSLAYAGGRLGCFFAGCCYGTVCNLPWAISFSHDSLTRHPTQLYAVFGELLIILILLKVERLPFFLYSRGLLFSTWLGLHAANRMIMEIFRDDDRGPSIFGLSLSTCLSGILLISSVVVFLSVKKNEARRSFSARIRM